MLYKTSVVGAFYHINHINHINHIYHINHITLKSSEFTQH